MNTLQIDARLETPKNKDDVHIRKLHKPLWCMEDERDGEAANPGPPRPGTGPKHTLTYDKKRKTRDEESTDDGESNCSSLEVFQEDEDADFDPGPHTPWESSHMPEGTVLFESGNCTSFRKHFEYIATRQHHAAAYQEAKVPEADHERLKLVLAKRITGKLFSPTHAPSMLPRQLGWLRWSSNQCRPSNSSRERKSWKICYAPDALLYPNTVSVQALSLSTSMCTGGMEPMKAT